MSGAITVAIVAAVGNLLQGWDAAAVAGSIVHIKREFNHGELPVTGDLIVVLPLIGAAIATIVCGAASDYTGRRPLLIVASILYFISGIGMVWSPNVYILLLARVFAGFGIGLAANSIPIFISETAPPEKRGSLATIPQFFSCLGMLVSYFLVFGITFLNNFSWRLMFGVLAVISLVYLFLLIFVLPESPRWLVTKGRMLEARHVLQRLRGKYVASEMSLLVEGIRVGGKSSIKEYTIGPAYDLTNSTDNCIENDHIKLYGPEGLTWIARPAIGQSSLLTVLEDNNNPMASTTPFTDLVVRLFESIHRIIPEAGSMPSAFFATFGSMFSIAGQQPKPDEWAEENLSRTGEDYATDVSDGDDNDYNLESPLISRHETSLEKGIVPGNYPGSILSIRGDEIVLGELSSEELLSSMNIGGGWQLAWQLFEGEGDGVVGKDAMFLRIYLHRSGKCGFQRGTFVSLNPNEAEEESQYFQATALVSDPALYSEELLRKNLIGPAMIHPSEICSKKWVKWSDLFQPGVKHALALGFSSQLLQQFVGVNAILYHTPKIFEEAGIEILVSKMGFGSESSSFLISGITMLVMLPCIAVAMQLIDITGRRRLLLGTIPLMVAAQVVIVVANLVDFGGGDFPKAVVSTIGVILYLCSSTMGIGTVPNILCSEIFPTRIRGLGYSLCALAFWLSGIIVVLSLPLLTASLGVGGVYGVLGVISVICFFFVLLKVPETKGMPLEVIAEVFKIGSK